MTTWSKGKTLVCKSKNFSSTLKVVSKLFLLRLARFVSRVRCFLRGHKWITAATFDASLHYNVVEQFCENCYVVRHKVEEKK